MSSTKDFALSMADFAQRTAARMDMAPQTMALSLWELLVDATPVLTGLTRANWKFSINDVRFGPLIELSAAEYSSRQKENNPLPRPDSPTVGKPHPGDVFYISNATIDPWGHQYLFDILGGTPSQPLPWFMLSLMEVQIKAPELLFVSATQETITTVTTP